MRADQLLKLQQIEERLIDVLLQEADPDQWPGKDIPLAMLSRDDRGNRYWCKKNAAATLSVITKTVMLQNVQARGGWSGDASNDSDMDSEISRAEREAEKRLTAFQARLGHDKK